MQAFGGFSQIQTFVDEHKIPEQEHSAANLPTNRNCEADLVATFRRDFSQKHHLSRLASDARGKDKSECLQEL